MRKLNVLLVIFDVLGVNFLFRLFNRNKACILWYHGICQDGFDLLKDYDERHVSMTEFRRQLAYLKSKGYTFVTMSEMVEAFQKGKKINKYVSLTFDDGFKNVVENAYPVMKEVKAKGCVYLVSGLIGGDQLLWTDYIETVVRNSGPGNFQFNYKGKVFEYELNSKQSYEKAMQDIKDKLRLIPDNERKEHIKQFHNIALREVPEEFQFSSWAQIKGLDPSVLEVGSHTVNHPNCANLTTEEELNYELGNSRMHIEREVDYPVRHFCYPAGSYNEKTIEFVRKNGYLSATTIHPGFNNRKTDLFQLNRIFVGEDFHLFKANVSGSYQFISRIIRFFKRPT